jgi:hypothetical protein
MQLVLTFDCRWSMAAQFRRIAVRVLHTSVIQSELDHYLNVKLKTCHYGTLGHRLCSRGAHRCRFGGRLALCGRHVQDFLSQLIISVMMNGFVHQLSLHVVLFPRFYSQS